MIFSSCSICSYARGARSGGPYRLRAPAMTRCRSQLSSVCPSGTSNGGSCGAISASSNAHCSPSSAAAVTASGRCANSRAISSPDRRCEPPSGASQPAASSIELPGPDRAHRHGQPSARRLGEMRGGGGDDADAEPRRQLGERGVALVVERMAVMGQLDADPVARRTGPPDRPAPRPPLPGRRRKAPDAHGLCGSRSGCASARRPPRSARRSRSAACPSRRRPDAPPPTGATAADTPPGPRASTSRCGPGGSGSSVRAPPPSDSSAPNTVRMSSSLAASANRTTPYSPSWSVSAMARRSSRAASSTSSSGVLAPSRKLYAECACSSAYGDGRAGRAATLRRLIAPALAGPGRAVAAVADLLGDGRTGTARLAGEHPLHLGPARRPVVPAHPVSVSNICSILVARRLSKLLVTPIFVIQTKCQKTAQHVDRCDLSARHRASCFRKATAALRRGSPSMVSGHDHHGNIQARGAFSPPSSRGTAAWAHRACSTRP